VYNTCQVFACNVQITLFCRRPAFGASAQVALDSSTHQAIAPQMAQRFAAAACKPMRLDGCGYAAIICASSRSVSKSPVVSVICMKIC
jgi:hypothetical protein